MTKLLADLTYVKRGNIGTCTHKIVQPTISEGEDSEKYSV